jgi:hypothetical protein
MSDFVTESIVRELGKVEAEPMVYIEGDDMTDGYWVCGLCEVHADNHWVEPFHNSWKEIPHAEFCLWRRAREWIDANPPRVNPGFRL